MTDNTIPSLPTDILDGTHAGLIFRSVGEAARAMLLDHLTVMGEHGPASALEVAYTEGQESIMAEIRFCYDYNTDQLKAISDAWDDAIEYLTDEVAREEEDDSFDAADLF